MDSGKRTCEVRAALGLHDSRTRPAPDTERRAILVFSGGCCDQDAIDRLAKGDEVWQVSAEVSGSEVFENRTPEERPVTSL